MIEASVVICAYTFDRWDDLVASVASVRAQVPPAREIFVVIDNNEPLRQAAKAKIAGVKVVANSKVPGLSGGRMTGAELATAPIIVFLDDDAVADPGWLAALLAEYQDERVLGVGGHIDPLWRVPRPAWFPAEFNWIIGCTYAGMHVENKQVRNMIGANMSFRADVLCDTGDFEEKLGRRDGVHKAGTADDTEFCIRAARLHPGGIFVYCQNARVRHVVSGQRTTWRYFVDRCRLEGNAKALLTSLTGTKDGLASERRYVLTLINAVLREIVTGNFRCAAAICAGFSITTATYARARLAR
jgi:GT2 family glycosyltransferase